MSDPEQIATRYLLGELTEREQTALEEKYFTDPQLFDQVVSAETELVDDYARGRLSPQMRQQFEQAYLAHPQRRERLRFAETLAARLDQVDASGVAAKQSIRVESWWARFSSLVQGEQRALAFSMMLVVLFLTLGSVWLGFKARRAGQELAQTQAQQAAQEQRERQLQQQLADERTRNRELMAELEKARAEKPQTGPAPPESSAPAFVTLLLFASGIRGTETGSAPALTVPRGTQQVRLQLNLKDNSYQRYQVQLRAIGGQEIFSRRNLKPQATKTGARFVFSLSEAKFSTGDYMLTLRGVAQDGEVEDVSKSLFRIEKK
ncbi:MAG: hypothetical protein ND895_23350 [Pyrinomonadaceae bacterium]|nr:hypothetical protein [Pyrinomonadaceae bacterium]